MAQSGVQAGETNETRDVSLQIMAVICFCSTLERQSLKAARSAKLALTEPFVVDSATVLLRVEAQAAMTTSSQLLGELTSNGMVNEARPRSSSGKEAPQATSRSASCVRAGLMGLMLRPWCCWRWVRLRSHPSPQCIFCACMHTCTFCACIHEFN